MLQCFLGISKRTSSPEQKEVCCGRLFTFRNENQNIMSRSQKNASYLKYVSLVTLTVQNAALGLSMRYAQTREGPRFISTTAVLMAEVMKFFTCLLAVYFEEGSIRGWVKSLHKTIVLDPVDTLKVSIPSLLYVIQNNLIYLSSKHLDAATYQVTYQLKILTTAVFAVVILRRKLLKTQWLALLVLLAGVVLVQIAKTEEGPSKVVTITNSTSNSRNGNDYVQSRFIGFNAVLAACVISGFAGIYFEKILKGADISVWMRNVQLSLLSIPISLISCFATDSDKILNSGFFFGYDHYIIYLITLQAGGGLIVAMVVKYADNILKGFATSSAIIISCVVSIILFNFQLTIVFIAGAALVIASIFLYGYVPKAKPAKESTLQGTEKFLV